MAIVKTNDTASLAADIMMYIDEAVSSLDSTADDVQFVVDKIASPDYYWENGLGTETRQTSVSSTSATYSRILDEWVWSNDYYYVWPESSTSRMALYGSNLDGSGEGVANATRYTKSYVVDRSIDVAGFSGVSVVRENTSAVIERDLSGSLLDISKYNCVVYKNYHSGGFGSSSHGLYDRIVSTESVSFDGLAKYDVGSLLSLTFNSYIHNINGVMERDGDHSMPSLVSADKLSFQLKSAGGLTYIDSSKTFSGSINQLLYSAIETHGVSDKELSYFKYSNTSAVGDEINLQALENYYGNSSTLNRDLWMAELLKGNDSIVVTGNEDSDIYAGAGNDKITGANGDDDLYGESGDDVVNGGNGEDYIEGGDGRDTLKGGAHNDEIYGDAGDDVLDGGTGNDLLAGGTGNDRLLGGLGNDQLKGEADDDYLDGGAGNDELIGGAGNDTLKGGAGHDFIRGEDGADIIDGGAGNDLIIGGTGVDVMTGGTGVDGFWFKAGDSGVTLGTLDQIKGFNVDQDQILFNFSFADSDISVLDASASYASLLATAEAANKRIVVGYDEGNTYVFADMDNNGSVDLAVQLVGVKGAAAANAVTFDYLAA